MCVFVNATYCSVAERHSISENVPTHGAADVCEYFQYYVLITLVFRRGRGRESDLCL